MSESNKELAIDIAIEYVHGILHQTEIKWVEGLPVETCCDIITQVYDTLEELDKKVED